MSFLEKLARLFKQLPRSLYWVVFAAIVVRLILFIYLIGIPMGEPFLQSDSHGYLQIAQNIVAGHGFSMQSSSPYYPDTIRVPFYPYLLATFLALFHSYLPVLLLQIFISGAIVVITYLIAQELSSKPLVPLLAAFGMALEPFSIFISLNLLTEVLFLFILSLGILAALYYIKQDRPLYLAVSSILFGVATLIRPIAEFLPIALLFYCLPYFPGKKFWRRAAITIIPFLIVISPWLIRNYNIYGIPALSSGGFQNIYSDLGATIVSQRDDVQWKRARENLNSEFIQTHGVGEGGIQEDLKFSAPLFDEGVSILLHNPIPTAISVTRLSFTFFTNDLWVYFFQKWDLVHSYSSSFSPSFVLTTQGPIVAFKETIEMAGASIIIPLIGRIFWIFVDTLSIIGFIYLYRQKGTTRKMALSLTILIIYFWLTSLSAGAGVNGRYRYPVDPIIFSVAAVGGVELYNRWQSRHARIRSMEAVL